MCPLYPLDPIDVSEGVVVCRVGVIVCCCESGDCRIDMASSLVAMYSYMASIFSVFGVISLCAELISCVGVRVAGSFERVV